MSDEAISGRSVTTLIDLLDQLAEPAEPAPVSMMPETIGWAVLAALLVALVGWLVVRTVRRRRANAYRREALALLAGAGDDARAIAPILRRTALAAYPRERVASLSGAAWLAFLDRTGGGPGFRSGPGEALVSAPYRDAERETPGLGALAARWVRRHGPVRDGEAA